MDDLIQRLITTPLTVRSRHQFIVEKSIDICGLGGF